MHDAQRALGFEGQRRPDPRPAQARPGLAGRTVPQVAELRPGRVALYAYAHLPQRFLPQRRSSRRTSGTWRTASLMLSQAIAASWRTATSASGWTARAAQRRPSRSPKRQGRLHRNFQGYSTQPDCDLIGLGVSAISKVGATYAERQDVGGLHDSIGRGELPVVRGFALSRRTCCAARSSWA